jgi:hypothetical protein
LGKHLHFCSDHAVSWGSLSTSTTNPHRRPLHQPVWVYEIRLYRGRKEGEVELKFSRVSKPVGISWCYDVKSGRRPPSSADHEQDWQPYPVDPYSAICDGHTIHSILTMVSQGYCTLSYRTLTNYLAYNTVTLLVF